MKEYIAKNAVAAFDVKKKENRRVNRGETIFLNASDKSTVALLKVGAIEMIPDSPIPKVAKKPVVETPVKDDEPYRSHFKPESE